MNDIYRIMFNPALEKLSEEFTAEFTKYEDAKSALELLADYTLFLHETSVMVDYSNCGYIEKFESDEWSEVDND